jgi:integrase/recombinase XerD
MFSLFLLICLHYIYTGEIVYHPLPMGASAKIILYTSKTYTGNIHPVLLRVIIDRKVVNYNCKNLKCKSDQWDSEKNLFKKEFQNFKLANQNLHTVLGTAEKILLNLQDEKPNFTHADFKRQFIKKEKRIFLFKYMDEIIIRLKDAGHIGNSETYQTTRNVLFKFFNETDLELSEITNKNIAVFIEHCQSKKLKPNSINNYLRTLRAVYNRAIKEEGYEYYPFKNFNWKPLKNKTQKRAISKDHIKSIINFECEPGTPLFHARQYFTFMYLTYGLNFSDLAKIQESNIIRTNEVTLLVYNRSKGGKLYEIPLNDKALEILDYYRNLNQESIYIFPILNENIHATPEQIKTRIKTALKVLNSDLRNIAGECKIPGKISSYVSRHTFASVLAKSGTSVFTIGEMMGHSDVRTTQIYLKELDYSEKIEASKNLMD